MSDFIYVCLFLLFAVALVAMWNSQKKINDKLLDMISNLAAKNTEKQEETIDYYAEAREKILNEYIDAVMNYNPMNNGGE